MSFNVDKFSHNLFAYLYRHYKETPTSELAAGFPFTADYFVSDDFDVVIGETQLAVNKFLRPFFQDVFNKACIWAGRSEGAFLDFCKGRFQTLPKDHIPILFLTVCAFVSELNLYLFQRECFRYAQYAPVCLSEIIRSSNEIVSMLNAGDLLHLKECCSAILEDIENDPDYVPILEAVGNRFKTEKDNLIDWESELNALPIAKNEGQPEDLEKVPLLGTAATIEQFFTPEECKYCKKTDCAKFIEQFKVDFKSKYNQ